MEGGRKGRGWGYLRRENRCEKCREGEKGREGERGRVDYGR